MEADHEQEPKEQPVAIAGAKGPAQTGNANPSAHSQGKKPGPIPWPKDAAQEPARAGEKNRPAPKTEAELQPATTPPADQEETELVQRLLAAKHHVEHIELDAPSLELRP
jgi:hypothetical protein